MGNKLTHACAAPSYLPTPDEISQACRAIQAGWDRVTEHERRGLSQDDLGPERPGKLATTPPVPTAGLPPTLRAAIDQATWWR